MQGLQQTRVGSLSSFHCNIAILFRQISLSRILFTHHARRAIRLNFVQIFCNEASVYPCEILSQDWSRTTLQPADAI